MQIGLDTNLHKYNETDMTQPYPEASEVDGKQHDSPVLHVVNPDVHQIERHGEVHRHPRASKQNENISTSKRQGREGCLHGRESHPVD